MKTILMLSLLGTLTLQDKVDLKVGDAAPAFEAKDDAGKDWKSADHVGKKIVVVYFYPASFTGGCTKQACGFRDDMKAFTEKDVEVIGVSGDSVANQEAFKKFHNLNFTLLADEKGQVGKAFGVPTTVESKVAKVKVDGAEKEFTRGATIQRWTFIIDKAGKIAFKNSNVKAAEDSKAVMEALQKIQ
jgi:peroxiredoxin Q/BCP